MSNLISPTPATPLYVIDASVFVADARPSEPDHQSAKALLNRLNEEQWQILLPAIALAEIAAAIARAHRYASLARRLVLSLQSYNHIEVVAIDNILGLLAADLASQYKLRGCDAIYVALAQFRNATLVTLDQEQKLRVPNTITARSPLEELATLSSSSQS